MLESSQTLERAAASLARGDSITALSQIGLDKSALALLLRGIAYAQIGDMDLAFKSLKRALSEASTPLLTARVRAALVEVELDRGEAHRAAREAAEVVVALERLNDLHNASMLRLVQARAEVFLGRLADAARTLDDVVERALPPVLRALGWLAKAEIAIRSAEPTRATRALKRARALLRRSPHELLSRALDSLERDSLLRVARIARGANVTEANLFDIEKLSERSCLLVDACRRFVRGGAVTVPLVRRPVLFALLSELAAAWPEPVARDDLICRAFHVGRPNESLRVRLRVELGRLRSLMDGLHANVVATPVGYALGSKREVVRLLPLSDDEGARIAVLLGDGASWTARALAESVGVSPRSVQRALQKLLERQVVEKVGAGKDQRYVQKGAPVASRMLLLGLIPLR